MTSLTTDPQSTTPQPTTIIYPSSDGEPVAETYVHFYALLVTLEVLRQYLAGRQASVLANQFLYYAQGFPKLRVTPDVMVIFDVAPGGRDSYKIWEEGQVPSVIFELTSEGTCDQDKIFKRTLYEQLGVQEYWLFDPKGEWIEGQLQGYRLGGDLYELITDGRSQPLQLRLQPEGELLTFYREDTGEKLLAPEELAQALEQSQIQIEAERLKAEQERQRADRLAAQLRALGVDPEAE
ncbi:MAG TPA: Uma2 family endonuclease [Candidatus Obscuribacterales bacterium]